MYCCDDFQVHRFTKCLREWEAASTKGHLGCRPSMDKATYLKGTVHNSKQKSFPLGIKFNTPNAASCFVEAICVAGKGSCQTKLVQHCYIEHLVSSHI